MSPQIEILELILLFAAIAVFTAGIAGSRMNLQGKKYFRLSFVVILALSVVIIQMAVLTYLTKFEIYYGWNAAIMVFAIAAIIISPFIFRIAGTLRPVLRSFPEMRRQSKPALQNAEEVPESVVDERADYGSKSAETKLSAEITAITELVNDTKPFGMAQDEINPENAAAENMTADKEEKSAEKHIEPENEKIKAAEYQLDSDVTEKGAVEKLPKTNSIKKSQTGKRTPVKKAPSRKTASKTKRRGKK
ncbi:MAG TPA: hypothetical protein PKE39_04560 [Ignavibacteria bacterium]|nr:hypothetical protein [Ignavibacteria bacterium]HMQ98275.1 hypothetical protein [Ignavibacteria bacterium]